VKALVDALNRLEVALRSYGAPIAEAFRPGLDAADVAATLNTEGVSPHEDVLAWFGWHDSAEPSTPTFPGGETILVGPWWMFDLASALSHRRMVLDIQRRMIDDVGESEALVVPESWLPLLTTLGGGDLCIDTAGPCPAPLWILEPETQDEQTSPQFPSLADFADDVTRALQEGHVYTHDGWRNAPFLNEALPQELSRLVAW
jgi:hypothetical protein